MSNIDGKDINKLSLIEVDATNGNIGLGGATNPPSQLTQKSTATNEMPAMGAELLSALGWTATDWTGDFATGFAHTTGNVTALSNTLAAVINNYYHIAFVVTGRTAGTFTVSYGGQVSGSYSSSSAFAPKATTTGNLIITPTTDFNGTIVISIKQITGSSLPIYAVQDSLGVNNYEVRSSLNILYNTFSGKLSGRYNTTGVNNSAQGVSALQNNTTGSNNSAQGVSALYFNTTGSNNSAQGVSALYFNTTGGNNSAHGAYALQNNTTGSNNSAQGYAALYSNTTGSNNSAQGVSALYSNTTGGSNSAYGFYAGRYIADGVTGRTTGNNGTYIGDSTRASADGTTNETVIGSGAIGSGSNTVTIGSSAVTLTVISSKIALTSTGGYAIKVTNKTGGSSVKGTVVYASPTTDNAFTTNPIDGDMPFGVVYESGIADGSECWVVVSGIAEVLLVNSVATTRSYIAYSSASVAGRIDTAAAAPVETLHFREIGHTLESKAGGTNVLVKCVLHFN